MQGKTLHCFLSLCTLIGYWLDRILIPLLSGKGKTLCWIECTCIFNIWIFWDFLSPVRYTCIVKYWMKEQYLSLACCFSFSVQVFCETCLNVWNKYNVILHCVWREDYDCYKCNFLTVVAYACLFEGVLPFFSFFFCPPIYGLVSQQPGQRKSCCLFGCFCFL